MVSHPIEVLQRYSYQHLRTKHLTLCPTCNSDLLKGPRLVMRTDGVDANGAGADS